MTPLDAARLRNILAAFYRPRGGGGVLGSLRRMVGRDRGAEPRPRGKGNEALGD